MSTTDLLRRRDNLRKVRVTARENIKWAAQIVDPIERRRRMEDFQIVLRSTESEWQELQRAIAVEQNLTAACRSARQPLASPVTRSTRGYMTRALGS